MNAEKPIKVLYISYDGILDPLGYSQVQAYLKGLAARGIKLEVISFEKRDRLDNSPARKKTEDKFRELDISWNPLLYHSGLSVLSTLYDIRVGVKQAKKISREFGFEIVHARSYIAALIAIIVRGDAKFLFDMRGFWPDERVEGGTWNKKGLIYKVFKYLEKKYIEKADAIVVLTEKAKKIVGTWLKQIERDSVPVEVIPTCADTNVFFPRERKTGKSPESIEIAYLGSLGTWYLIDEMLEFFRVLLKKYPDGKFRFITNSPDSMVIAAMDRNGYSEREKKAVEIEMVSHDEVPTVLASADATIFFIMPSYSKQGSCATKFAESLACGKPVIINSGVGDHDSHIYSSGAGVIVEGLSREYYQSAIDKLVDLLADTEIETKCRSFIEKEMSVDIGCEKYIKIYNELAGNSVMEQQ